MKNPRVSKRLEINGIVQGVGFRPFIYQLASRFGLNGDVANTASGVIIHAEGAADAMASFQEEIAANPPPLARITEFRSRDGETKNFTAFTIVKSEGGPGKSTLISPDTSICEDCLRELFDPDDRRYRYPFINCTNCGPRYTIIDDIPYDRPFTSMRHFKMCPACQAEYDDPGNRRFHAQPNACDDCGPHVCLHDNTGKRLAASDPIAEAAGLLKQGRILAVKGLGGFHLAVDAENDDAAARLRRRKRREEKPLALMAPDLAHIRKFAALTPEREALLTSARRPIVLLDKKEPNTISRHASPRNRYFGVMLPYTPLHHLLLSHGFTALVMTSGNLSEEPIAIDNDDALERLAGIADYFLLHDRDIYLRCDDSIVRRAAGGARFLRRSRGCVPVPVFLKDPAPSILAVGAELKNTICLTKGKNAFLSQHIGDMENLATHDFFEMTIRHMQRILDITPEIIAHDLHPDYMSTRFAMETPGVERIGVQHHHAHVASCMAENRVDGPVIGLSFDGSGYGTDGAIWGGEVLIADPGSFKRAAHLDYVPLPGGAAAIKEPWRMALSHLIYTYGEGASDIAAHLLKEIDENALRIIAQMVEKGFNSPDTSSLGRLFDGVAAIVGIRDRVAYEGQAAMELEMIADETVTETYDFQWIPGDPIRIDPGPIIRGVVDDLASGSPPSRISGKFHRSLVRMFTELCRKIRRDADLNRVALSGGVFQNAILLTGLIRSLERERFQVFTHRRVPANDGGVSLGQAAAAARIARG